MAITSTKANIEDRTYRKRLGRQEQRIVNVAEDYSPAVSADWTDKVGAASAPANQDDALDALAAAASGGAQVVVKAQYDFSADGGTQGDIGLGVTIPDDSVVLFVTQDVLVAPDSAGNTGTIKLKMPTDGDLTANITADAGTSGLVDGVQDWSAANAIKTTAARELTVEVGTEDMTAGKINFFVTYAVSD
jgi:hypothetical protein